MTEANDDAAPRGKGLRWDGTVTAGNVLTAAAMVLGLLIWGLRLESRVDRAEERQVAFERLAGAQRAEDRASEALAFVELRGSLRRIEDILMGRGPGTGNR